MNPSSDEASKTVLPSHTSPGATMGEAVFTREGGFMAAEVLGCGHAHHLFNEVSYMEGCPQVHLHFLTSDAEFRAQGFGVLEIVCHGCGSAALVYYTSDGASLEVRDAFKKKHRKCLNRGYEMSCPSYRHSVQVVDLRVAVKRKKRSGRSRATRRRR